MKPFLISEYGRRILGGYPSSGDIRELVRSMKPSELEYAIRHWFTEGTPYAFRDVPLLYEAVRSWLGQQLHVHPKMLTIVGSGRIGFSLDPGVFGRPFGSHSDLDITVVEGPLFNRLAASFHSWAADFAEGRAKPSNEREAFYWNKNLELVPQNIARGFIDQTKIPAHDAYKVVQEVRQSMFLLCRKLAATQGGFPVRGASVRVYRDWIALLLQLQRNLSGVVTAAAN